MQVRFRQARVAWILVALVALLAGAVPGGQRIALCISADGHLDLKLTTQACRNCPVTGCADDPAPDPAASRLPAGERCCLDLPLGYDLVGWIMPHQTGADEHAVAQQAPAPAPGTAAILPEPAGPPRGGPPLVPAVEHHDLAAACLATTVLLL